MNSLISQTYVNIESVPVEVQYVFPVDANSVIYNLTIKTTDNKTIVAEIMESQKAQEVYKKAIEQGNTAFMAHYDSDNSQDKVIIMIGNLQPKVNVTVTFHLATPIKPTLDGDWRIVIPAALTPKFPTELAKNVSSQYNLTSANYFRVQQQVPYNINFTLNITSLSSLSNIRCASHEIVYTPYGNTGAFISLNPQKQYQPDKDMIILFKNEEQNKARVLVGKESTFYSTMVSFYPFIESNSNQNQEFILVLDRSGSMWGERIELAKKTCMLFVQSLPLGSYFNIISFGSDYQLMWERSVEYNDEFRTYALNQIQTFGADMGGTEILRPLQEIYSQGLGELPKTIFLITDGAVSNPDAVVKIIAENSDSMGIRVHAFGIGAGVSTYLVNNAAEAGKGTASFVQENEPVDDKVIHAMEIALQPYLQNFNITWNMTNSAGKLFSTESSTLLQAPKFIKYLLNKEIAFVYAIIMDDTFLSGNLSISYLQEGKQQKQNFTISAQQAMNNTAITRLAARNLIRELEKKEGDNKEMIIYLSTKFGILSSLTSYIAVQEVYDPVNKTMVRRDIPIAATQDSGFDSFSNGKLRGGGGPIAGYAMPQAAFAQNSFSKSQNAQNQPEQDMADANEAEENNQQNSESQQGYISLIYLQKADGSFQLNNGLATVLEVQLTSLKSGIPQLLSSYNNKEDLWGTALAISELENKYANNQSSWKLVAKKAQDWLHGQGLSDEQIDQLKEKAVNLLANDN